MGTFDLLHPGHLHLFRTCASYASGGEVVVTVNSDDFVEWYKGRRAVMDAEARRQVVESVRWVDRALVHTYGPDAKPTIEYVRPTMVLIGEDWRDRDYLGQLGVDQSWLDERRVQVVYVPLLEGHSSTALREAMA